MSAILVVDDEPAIVDLLLYNLGKAGHQARAARDGREALDQIDRDPPDLIILDLMLPGMDGLEVCREARKRGDTPIIMLTARDEEIDRVLGLELGADDYVAKPFSVRELMARVKAVLRRARPAGPTAGAGAGAETPGAETADAEAVSQLRAGDLRLDPSRRQAAWRGVPIALTAIQFDVLRLLMARPGQVFTRQQLLDQAWGFDYFGDARAVDSTIKRLRARLREAAPDREFVATVRDVGYKFEGGD
jgi:DNA-binding response OmpR family regulator